MNSGARDAAHAMKRTEHEFVLDLGLRKSNFAAKFC